LKINPLNQGGSHHTTGISNLPFSSNSSIETWKPRCSASEIILWSWWTKSWKEITSKYRHSRIGGRAGDLQDKLSEASINQYMRQIFIEEREGIRRT